MTEPNHTQSRDEASRRERIARTLEQVAALPPSVGLDELQPLLADLQASRLELLSQNRKLQVACQQLEAYRDRYVDLYDFAPLGYTTLDEEGYVQEINLAGVQLLGRQREELVGFPFADHVAPPLREAFFEHLRKCCGSHREVTSELSLTAKDGHSIAVQLHSVPIEAPGQEGAFCKTAIADISERKQIEEALRQEKLLSDNIIDSIPGVFYVHDRQGRLVRWNRSYEETTGRPPDELHGADCLLHIHEDDKTLVAERVAEVFERGSAEVEARVNTRLGVRYFLLTGRRMDVNGTAYMIGTGIDITDRKAAQQALQESENRFRNLAEHAPFGISLDDAQGNVVFTNQAFKELFGYAREDVPTQADWYLRVYPDENYRREVFATWREDLRRVRSGEIARAPVREYRVTCADGSVKEVEIAFAIMGGETYVVFNDVSRHKRAEEALQKAHHELEQRVEQRTAELSGMVDELQSEVQERIRTEEELQQERRTLQHLLQASDHERQLIAYEIHDGLAQQLAAAIMNLQTAEDGGMEASRASAARGTALRLLRQALNEARRLISDVRPPILDEEGIEAALAHMVHDHRALGARISRCTFMSSSSDWIRSWRTPSTASLKKGSPTPANTARPSGSASNSSRGRTTPCGSKSATGGSVSIPPSSAKGVSGYRAFSNAPDC